jgi:alpha-glucosidase (family GH31 glycosyl hydrolase)
VSRFRAQFEPSQERLNARLTWFLHSGHAFGAKDNELYARWVQLGVWSPILRLHSNENIFNTKEPWTFNPQTCAAVTRSLQLRHRLIPYLYTMNYVAATEAGPLVRPVYYEHPRETPCVAGSYEYKRQFFFGSELLMIPISARTDYALGCSQVRAWLPPGDWIDIESGATYNGGREMLLHRTLETYPSLCPSGFHRTTRRRRAVGKRKRQPGHVRGPRRCRCKRSIYHARG